MIPTLKYELGIQTLDFKRKNNDIITAVSLFYGSIDVKLYFFSTAIVQVGIYEKITSSTLAFISLVVVTKVMKTVNEIDLWLR